MDANEKTPSTWLLLLIGAVGSALGYMLAHGVMPFQRVPFERMEIGPDVAAPLFGLALMMLLALSSGFRSGVSTIAGRLRGIGPAFARWLAPHIAAAAAEAKAIGEEDESPSAAPQDAPQTGAPRA